MSPRNTATDRLLRRLALLSYLGAHGHATFADLSRHFGVDLRTVVDDVLALWTTNGRPDDDTMNFVDFTVDVDDELDLQGPWDPAVVGPATVTLTQGQNLDRPVPLSTGEAASVMLGLRQIAELLGPGDTDGDDGLGPVREAVTGALAKVTAAAPVALDVAPGTAAPVVDPEVRRTVTRATEEGRRLRLRYVSADEAETVRDVDPIDVHGERGLWILRAWCHRARGERSFRLDRIREVEVLDSRTEEHPDRDATSPTSPAPPEGSPVHVSVDSRALWRVEEVPHEEIEDLGDGGLRVRLQVANPAWFAGFLLRLGPRLRAVEPPEAAADAARRARAALAAYAQLDRLSGSRAPHASRRARR